MNTTWPTVAERGRILLLPPGRAHWERPLRTFCAHCAPDPTPSPSQEGSNTGWPVPLLGGVRGGWLAGRFMGSPLSFFRMHWDHEPDNALLGARLCEPQGVATAPSPAGHRPALRDARFMESPLSLRACIGTRNRSGSDRGRSPPAAAAQRPGRG